VLYGQAPTHNPSCDVNSQAVCVLRQDMLQDDNTANDKLQHSNMLHIYHMGTAILNQKL
jgi:hypothetical protein